MHKGNHRGPPRVIRCRQRVLGELLAVRLADRCLEFGVAHRAQPGRERQREGGHVRRASEERDELLRAVSVTGLLGHQIRPAGALLHARTVRPGSQGGADGELLVHRGISVEDTAQIHRNPPLEEEVTDAGVVQLEGAFRGVAVGDGRADLLQRLLDGRLSELGRALVDGRPVLESEVEEAQGEIARVTLHRPCRPGDRRCGQLLRVGGELGPGGGRVCDAGLGEEVSVVDQRVRRPAVGHGIGPAAGGERVDQSGRKVRLRHVGAVQISQVGQLALVHVCLRACDRLGDHVGWIACVQRHRHPVGDRVAGGSDHVDVQRRILALECLHQGRGTVPVPVGHPPCHRVGRTLRAAGHALDDDCRERKHDRDHHPHQGGCAWTKGHPLLRCSRTEGWGNGAPASSRSVILYVQDVNRGKPAGNNDVTGRSAREAGGRRD